MEDFGANEYEWPIDVSFMPEARVVGVRTRIYDDKEVGACWRSFMSMGMLQTVAPYAAEDKLVCVYTYQTDGEGLYDITIGVLADPATTIDDLPQGLSMAAVPAGLYKLYETDTPSPEAVQKAWQIINGDTSVTRAKMADIEIYTAAPGEEQPVAIYVGIIINPS